MSYCSFCGAEVVWADVPGSRPVALNPTPHPRGSRVLDAYGCAGPGGGGVPRMRVRYVPHWTTCPKYNQDDSCVLRAAEHPFGRVAVI